MPKSEDVSNAKTLIKINKIILNTFSVILVNFGQYYSFMTNDVFFVFFMLIYLSVTYGA